MTVEAELAEDAEQEDELCVFLSELNKQGLAMRKGAFYFLKVLLDFSSISQTVFA